MSKAELRAAYPIGARVVATALYRENFGPYSRMRANPTGVVTGYGASEGLIRVRRDGHQQPRTYHQQFWDVIV